VVRSVGPNSAADLVITTDGCADTSDVVRSLEHVQVVVTLSASQRGKVKLSLTSPSGTRQIMLARRHVDVSAQGLNDWTLLTVHCWGEDPRGNWTLTVSTTSTSGNSLSFEYLVPFIIIMFMLVSVVGLLHYIKNLAVSSCFIKMQSACTDMPQDASDNRSLEVKTCTDILRHCC